MSNHSTSLAAPAAKESKSSKKSSLKRKRDTAESDSAETASATAGTPSAAVDSKAEKRAKKEQKRAKKAAAATDGANGDAVPTNKKGGVTLANGVKNVADPAEERSERKKKRKIKEGVALDVQDIEVDAGNEVAETKKETKEERRARKEARKIAKAQKGVSNGGNNGAEDAPEPVAAAGHVNGDQMSSDAVNTTKQKKDKKDKKKKSKHSQPGIASAEQSADAEVTAEDGPSATLDGTTDENAAGTSDAHNSRFIVFIGNLPFTATNESLAAHFSSLHPDSIRHITDKETGKSKGFAFLEFTNYDRMRTCLKLYHHSMFDDGKGKGKARRINVELTAGGGGKGEGRMEKVKVRNERLQGQRTRRAEVERKQKERKAAKAALKGEDVKDSEAAIKKPAAQEVQSGSTTMDGMHPSRRAMLHGGGRW